MTEIKETAITWEHDTGLIVISTRSRKIAGKLRRLGLKQEGDPTEDYATFRTTQAFLRVGLNRRATSGRKAPPRRKIAPLESETQLAD